MHEAVLELMSVLVRGAEVDDDCAGQLAAIAADATDAGQELVAEGMLCLARNHRIRAMELRGRLAVFSVEYGGIFHQDLVEN